MAKRQGQQIIDKSPEPSCLRAILIIDHVPLFSWGRHRGSGREPQGVRATVHRVAPRFRSLPTSTATLQPVPFTKDSYHQRSLGCCCQLDDDCYGQTVRCSDPPPKSPAAWLSGSSKETAATPLSEDCPCLPGPVASGGALS